MGDLISEPIQLLGLGFILLTFVTQMVLGVKLYRTYRENKSRTTLTFSLTFISWGLALIFLTLERILITEIGLDDPGIVFAYAALISSIFAVLALDTFASYATFPKHVKKLMIIPVILAIWFLITIFWDERATVLSMEIEFQPLTRITMFFTLVPLFIYPIAVISYYTFTMWFKSRPHAKRAALVTIAIICVNLIYFYEVIGDREAYFINPLRGLYVIATILFFISFTRLYELKWPEKIRHLYISHATKGLCLYEHSFVGKKRMESNIVTGFITGLTMLVQEITQSNKKLKVVDVEDVKILLEHGKKNIIGILMTEENLKTLHNKLREIVDRFESEFDAELTDFTGSVNEFEKTKELVEQIFAYKDIFDLPPT